MKSPMHSLILRKPSVTVIGAVVLVVGMLLRLKVPTIERGEAYRSMFLSDQCDPQTKRLLLEGWARHCRAQRTPDRVGRIAPDIAAVKYHPHRDGLRFWLIEVADDTYYLWTDGTDCGATTVDVTSDLVSRSGSIHTLAANFRTFREEKKRLKNGK